MKMETEYRPICGKEFEINSQVRYDAAFMSRPEFVTYYRTTRGYEVGGGAGLEITELYSNLCEDAIKIGGIDRSLRVSSLRKWKEENYVEPEPKKHDGRGRPKGTKNKKS